jgi:predicted aspartyl protease
MVMRTRRAKEAARITVDLEVANYVDLELARRGSLPPGQVRRQTVPAIVDSGAWKLVLPQAVARQLGLPLGPEVKVRYADGRQATRQEVQGIHVELLGRSDTFSALVQPKRTTALIGAIMLEALDLLVDCKNQRVIPRDPSGPMYEIE